MPERGGRMLGGLLDLLFVPRCASCGARMDKSGDGLCDACRRSYEHAKDEYCDFCGMTAAQCYCMPQNLLQSGCMSYRKLLFYKSDGTPVLHRLLYAVKRRNTAAAMRFLARELAAKTRDMVTPDTIVTYAPRSEASYRKYGYDQARELAKVYAKETGGSFRVLLARRPGRAKTEQKLLNARGRAANVRGAFRLRRFADVRGMRILQLDDVVTSGATLGECVRVLTAAGAAEVHCVSLAQTYRKNKRKND